MKQANYFLAFLFTHFSLSRACPDWTIANNNKCYYFSNISSGSQDEKYTHWIDAETNCACLGGHLASIDNIVENFFINKQLGQNQTWIGAEYVGNWTWSDGSPVTYTNWGYRKF